ncbi:MAG TPA: putative cytokinetic ring protein SteA [Armatimonadota bacterium]|nr:putative cytokinetic ring protein SteA [Armatimonadota bacterium]
MKLAIGYLPMADNSLPMTLKLTGTIRLDKRTKNLAKRLKPGEIALIDHQDIDSVSAQMLIDRRISAVINASKSISGRYPNLGPKMLLDAGIPIIDDVGNEMWDRIREGDMVEITGCQLHADGVLVCSGKQLTAEDVEHMLEEAKQNLDVELERFAENTLSYVLKEKSLLLDATKLPDIDTQIAGKHVLIVVRGEGYKEDLVSLRAYINEVKPVLIGVDGGADALLGMGYKPHIIIGDMDSVSDKALKCGAEIIVHAYTDAARTAPGMARLKQLGLGATIAAVPGTSEDVAMLLAYEKGAELIVAVGTHSNLIDFLDKGRKGMSSTFLVRLKVGSKLVDARGASKLYQNRSGVQYAGILVLAAMAALVTVIASSPAIQDQIRLFMIEHKARLWDLWVQLRLWER